MGRKDWLITTYMILMLQVTWGQDRRWLGGYASDLAPPYGGNKTLFPDGVQTFSIAEDRPMWLSLTEAVTTNAQDSVIAYTNGVYIANIAGDTMLNGVGLNPSFYTTIQYNDGLRVPGSHIFLPYPDSDSLIVLFHQTIDAMSASGDLVPSYFYMSVIDMSLDGGKGGVTQKNMILSSGLTRYGVSAVRHGNGRDWWVAFHEDGTDVFIQFLLTTTGAEGPFFQVAGVVRSMGISASAFSQDGSAFAFMDAYADLDVFDFDRCSGVLSNWRHVDINDGETAGFPAFSPNGRFLYVTSIEHLYQYDLDAPDLTTSQVVVAEWDSTYDPFPLATYFFQPMLAADGKIYISNGNGTRYMHIIDQPDSLGLACNVIQNGHYRQTYTTSSIPNLPNFHLGPLTGSPCDTLGLGIPGHPPPLHISAFPNPNTGNFTLTYPAQSAVGQLEIRDLSGRIVFQERIPQWSTVHGVDLRWGAAGIYQCTLRWGQRSANVRIIIQP